MNCRQVSFLQRFNLYSRSNNVIHNQTTENQAITRPGQCYTFAR